MYSLHQKNKITEKKPKKKPSNSSKTAQLTGLSNERISEAIKSISPDMQESN